MPQSESFASRNDPNYFVPIGTNNNIIPIGLKNQMILILENFCDKLDSMEDIHTDIKYSESIIEFLVNEIRDTAQVTKLSKSIYNYSEKMELHNFLENCDKFYLLMTAYELFCNILQEMLERHPHDYEIYTNPDTYYNIIENTINRVNDSFKRNGVGYEYNLDSHQFIPVDSELVSQNAVEPAIKALTEPRFTTALEELNDSYKNLKNNDPRNALVMANCAFESVMKIIYHERGWDLPKIETAKNLIDVAFKYGLIPKSSKPFTESLKGVLIGGVPTLRNKLGGHGQGVERKEVSEHLVRFVLNMTASLINFLIEADRNFNEKI